MAYKENYPSKLLEEAVDAISSLPGVGRRSALRLALHLLKQPQENVHHFTAAIDHLRDEVKYCRHCMMISDDDVCSICSDKARDHRTICVVESVRDVMSIENTGQYHGVYHVLGGIINPIEGISPNDLRINELLGRTINENIKEIILALPATIEGDTTNYYLSRVLKDFNGTISTIAKGISVGDALEYADEVTLGRSIANRIPYNKN